MNTIDNSTLAKVMAIQMIEISEYNSGMPATSDMVIEMYLGILKRVEFGNLVNDYVNDFYERIKSVTITLGTES